MSDTPMCKCGHRQANHSGIGIRKCMVSGCECKAFSEAMTPTPKEGPPTIRECLDMVVYLRRGLMTLNDRKNHDAGLTDKENEQQLFETGKAWISDSDDYMERLKPYAIDEALGRDEKVREMLEGLLAETRKRFPIDKNLEKRSSPYLEDVGILASLIGLDVLAPGPEEAKS